MGPYTHHNNLLGKLQLLDIYDLTDRALASFIEDIQNRRTQARVAARYKNISAGVSKRPKKRAKTKAVKKNTGVKRAKKAKRLGVGGSKG